MREKTSSTWALRGPFPSLSIRPYPPSCALFRSQASHLPRKIPGASRPASLPNHRITDSMHMDPDPSERQQQEQPERERANAETPFSSSTSISQPQLIPFDFTKALAREEELLRIQSCWFILPSYLLATPYLHLSYTPFCPSSSPSHLHIQSILIRPLEALT
jgi:hypothetical protein